MTYDFTKIIQGKPRLESEGFGTITKLSCICETNNKEYTVECVWSCSPDAYNPDITVSSDDWGTEAFDWNVRLYTDEQFKTEQEFIERDDKDAVHKWLASHFPLKDFATCVGITVEPIVEHLKRIHSAVTLLVTV